MPGNGIIEFPEFVDLMSRRPWGQLGSHEELREAMADAFDHTDDGHLQVRTQDRTHGVASCDVIALFTLWLVRGTSNINSDVDIATVIARVGS